jgi:hypothetical protein
MILSTWSDICRVLAIFGIALAVFGTIGHYAIGKVLDRRKNERIEQMEAGNTALKKDLSETDKRAQQAVEVIEAMRDYGEVATLNLIGKPYPDGDLVYTTPISKALEGSYKMEGTKVEFCKDEASERIYRDVIAKFPRFPFAYHALAAALFAKGDPSWRDYARQCVSILEKTTQVSGHHPNHDQRLAELKKAFTE